MTPLDWTHVVRDIPADGLPVERAASPEEMARLAEALDILSVDKLVVRYRLMSRAGGRIALTGTIAAHITQECVVTLDPVAATLSLPLDAVYTPQISHTESAAEGTLEDLEKPEEEPIENGKVDVGRVVLEELMSGIDPYPRRPDANFDWPDDAAEAAGNNPFAALERLRKPRSPD
jgi:uncharacterized metal-binding protein YceD (DUF177 family)